MKARKSMKCRFLAGLTFFAVFFVIGAGQGNAAEQDQDMAEFRNNSKDTIEFYVDAERGNIWFQHGACGTVKNGPCLLPPGTSTGIKYTTTNGRGHGFVNICCKTCKGTPWVKVGYTAKYFGGASFDDSGEFKGGTATGYEDADIMYRTNSPSSGGILVRVQLK